MLVRRRVVDRVVHVIGGIGDDVADVGIGQRVNDFPSAPPRPDQSALPKYSQVLRHQRLADPTAGFIQFVDDVVHAQLTIVELSEDCQSNRRAEGAQQLCG